MVGLGVEVLLGTGLVGSGELVVAPFPGQSLACRVSMEDVDLTRAEPKRLMIPLPR